MRRKGFVMQRKVSNGFEMKFVATAQQRFDVLRKGKAQSGFAAAWDAMFATERLG